MKVNLRSDDTPSNPNTGLPYIIIISSILLLSGIALIIYKKKKLSTLMIVIGLILLPVGVNALCTCEIVVDSKVEIKTEDKLKMVFYECYSDEPVEYTMTYKIGMSFSDFENNEYFNRLNDDEKDAILGTIRYSEIYFESSEYLNCISTINWPHSEDFQEYQDYKDAKNEAINQEQACNTGLKTDKDEKIKSLNTGIYRVKEVVCIN